LFIFWISHRYNNLLNRILTPGVYYIMSKTKRTTFQFKPQRFKSYIRIHNTLKLTNPAVEKREMWEREEHPNIALEGQMYAK